MGALHYLDLVNSIETLSVLNLTMPHFLADFLIALIEGAGLSQPLSINIVETSEDLSSVIECIKANKYQGNIQFMTPAMDELQVALDEVQQRTEPSTHSYRPDIQHLYVNSSHDVRVLAETGFDFSVLKSLSVRRISESSMDLAALTQAIQDANSLDSFSITFAKISYPACDDYFKAFCQAICRASALRSVATIYSDIEDRDCYKAFYRAVCQSKSIVACDARPGPEIQSKDYKGVFVASLIESLDAVALLAPG